jgi:uncharacterized membrane protein
MLLQLKFLSGNSMRVLKLGLISLVFLFLFITAISSLLPSTVNISRAIDIDAPVDSIYKNINDVTRWKKWFANYDSTNVTTSSNTVGKGASITINKTKISIVDDKVDKILTTWTSGSRSLDGRFNFYTRNGSSPVTLQWHFIQNVRWYPWEKFASIVSDKMMGPVMEKSLDNLKNRVEQSDRN